MSNATKEILTSIHGRRIGLSADKHLVVEGRVVVSQDNQGTQVGIQQTPSTTAISATLLTASIRGRLITTTQAPAVNIVLTLPTAAAIEAALIAAKTPMAVDECFEWSVSNVGNAAGTTTIAASAGHTIVGNDTIQAGGAFCYRTRKVSATSYISYRV